jgi:hypothetical protein
VDFDQKTFSIRLFGVFAAGQKNELVGSNIVREQTPSMKDIRANFEYEDVSTALPVVQAMTIKLKAMTGQPR